MSFGTSQPYCNRSMPWCGNRAYTTTVNLVCSWRRKQQSFEMTLGLKFLQVPFGDMGSPISRLPLLLQHIAVSKKKQPAEHQTVKEAENGSFTLAAMSSASGMGVEISTFYNRLASLLADNSSKPCNQQLCTTRCRLKFVVLHSAILCIRGSRSSKHKPFKPHVVDMITTEAHLAL